MSRFSRRQWMLAAAALGSAGLPGAARAAYPEKPVTLVVPFPPGGPSDGYGRAFASALSVQLKQTVVVDNRSGVGGALGVQSVARSAPDGYTIGMAGSGATVFMPLLTDKLLFDNFKDLTLLGKMVRTPNIMIVGQRRPEKTVAEVIATAKAQPGKLTFASAGVGTSTHVLAELFKLKSGLDILHVPYKGAAPALQDLIGAQVDMFFGEAPGVLPHIRGGKVRALFTCDSKRSRWLPEVPSAEEVGLPEVVLEGAYGLVAPAGLPVDIAQRLGQAIGAALQSAEVAAKFDLLSGVPDMSTGAEYGAHIRREQERWRAVIKAANIKLE